MGEIENVLPFTHRTPILVYSFDAMQIPENESEIVAYLFTHPQTPHKFKLYGSNPFAFKYAKHRH